LSASGKPLTLFLIPLQGRLFNLEGCALIEALILICALNLAVDGCDEHSAEDVIRVKVEPVACAMASESVIAGMPGDRAQGRFIKVICGRKE
jgi:hypothetical protein